MRFLGWLKRNRTTLITAMQYATAVAITVTIFIYLTFPWQKLTDWIQVKVERAMAVKISVDESRIRFPLRLEWDGVTITHSDSLGPVQLKVEKIMIGWPLGALLRREMDLLISSRLLGGEMRARLSARKSKLGVQYQLKGTARGLDLGELAGLFHLPPDDLTGTVDIRELEHRWLNRDWRRGEGRLVLEANGVEHQPLKIRFRRVSGTLTLKGGMSNFENVSALGPSLDLVGSGSLLLRPRMMNSLLNFNSRVTLRNPTGALSLLSALASPEGHLDFSVRGVLSHLTPYVNGSPFPSFGVGSPGPRSSPSPGPSSRRRFGR